MPALKLFALAVVLCRGDNPGVVDMQVRLGTQLAADADDAKGRFVRAVAADNPYHTISAPLRLEIPEHVLRAVLETSDGA